MVMTLVTLGCAMAGIGCSKKTEELPEKPEAFTLVSPEINAEADRQPTLSWTAAKGAVNYKVQVCLNSDFTELYFQKIISGKKCTYQLETLLDGNRAYYWRVVAVGRTGKTRVASNSPYLLTTPYAYLKLGALFRDNMVVQRNSDFNVYGEAKKGKNVSVTFDGETKETKADEKSGAFLVTFSVKDSDGIQKTLKVESENENITASNILIGDNILFAGQSNIQWMLKDSDYREDELNAPEQLRMFYQNNNPQAKEQLNCAGGFWASADGESELNYSALGYLFGSLLKNYQKDVPVGIIFAAKGDTHIQQWMSKDAFSDEFTSVNNGLGGNVYYNGMLAPLMGNKVAALVWYQGENNAWDSDDYSDLLTAFVLDMRVKLKGEVPVMIIQLPSYNTDIPKDIWAKFRLIQDETAKKLSNTYIICTCDGGDEKQIHPKQKHYIAERLLLAYRKYVLLEKNLAEYPEIVSANISGEEIVLTFSAAQGLKCDGVLKGFEIAGEDKVYRTVSAKINTDGTITLFDLGNITPRYIRYAYSNAPFINIFNEDNLPLKPFMIDITKM